MHKEQLGVEKFSEEIATEEIGSYESLSNHKPTAKKLVNTN